MATSASDGSGFSVVSGASWASTANAYDGSATTYATLTTTTAGSHVVDITGYAFAGVVSAGSTLSSVVVNVSQYVASATRWNNPTVQAYVGSTAIGSATTLTERTTAGNEDVTLTGVTLADVLSADFKVRFTANKSGTTSSVQNLGWANVTVTFTVPSVTDDTGLTDGLAVLQTVTQSDAGVGVSDPAPTATHTPGNVNHTRTVTDGAGLVDSRAVARAVVAIDAAGLADSLTVTHAVAHSRPVTDAVGLADVVAVAKGFTLTRGVTDEAGPADSLQVAPTTVMAATGVGVTDPLDVTKTSSGVVRTVTDPLGITDSQTVSKGSGLARTVTDQAVVSDALMVACTSVMADVGIGVSDPAPTVVKSGPVAHARTITDAEGVADPAQLVDIADEQTDDAGLTDSQRIARRVVPSDAVGLVDSRAVARVLRVMDSAGMTDEVSVLRAARSTRLVNDSIGATDSRSLAWARVVPATDAIGVADSVAVHLARVAADQVSLTDSLDVTQPGGSFRTVDDLVQSSDAPSVAQGHARAAVVVVDLADSLTVTRRLHVSLTDGVPASDLLAMGRGFTDDVSLTDDMIGVEVSGGTGRTIDNGSGLSDEVLVTLDRVVTVSDLLDVIDVTGLSRSLTVADVVGVAERFGTAPPSGTVRGVLRKGRISTRHPRPAVTAYEPKEARR